MRTVLAATVLCLALVGCAAPNHAELSAAFDRGVAAYDAGRFEEAYRIWSSIQDQDLAAMRNVAMMLRRGEGVKQDPKAAEAMYLQAAQAGLPTAQADLADMLLKGESGPPNPKAALPLLQSAARAGHPLAQYELAELYETGAVVPKDLAVARGLYAAAADRGVKQARDRLAALSAPPGAQQSGAPAP
jgi:TPR repeat protein